MLKDVARPSFKAEYVMINDCNIGVLEFAMELYIINGKTICDKKTRECTEMPNGN